jgi:site-specific recombinase XerD
VLLNVGGDMKMVQEILGHKTIDTTLEIYSHLSIERTRRLINDLLFGKSKK